MEWVSQLIKILVKAEKVDFEFRSTGASLGWCLGHRQSRAVPRRCSDKGSPPLTWLYGARALTCLNEWFGWHSNNDTSWGFNTWAMYRRRDGTSWPRLFFWYVLYGVYFGNNTFVFVWIYSSLYTLEKRSKDEYRWIQVWYIDTNSLLVLCT